MRCPKSRFPIRIIVFDELELILFVSQGLTLSTASLVLTFYHISAYNKPAKIKSIDTSDPVQATPAIWFICRPSPYQTQPLYCVLWAVLYCTVPCNARINGRPPPHPPEPWLTPWSRDASNYRSVYQVWHWQVHSRCPPPDAATGRWQLWHTAVTAL